MEKASFQASDLKIVSAIDCAPGTVVWAWWNREGAVEAHIRLASDEDDQRAHFLRLTGETSFSISIIEPRRPLSVLEVAKGPYLYEINKDGMSSSQNYEPGNLVVTVDGTYIAASSRQQGFPEPHFVSLSDWTVSHYPNKRIELNATAWSLQVDAGGQDGGLRTLFTFAQANH